MLAKVIKGLGSAQELNGFLLSFSLHNAHLFVFGLSQTAGLTTPHLTSPGSH